MKIPFLQLNEALGDSDRRIAANASQKGGKGLYRIVRSTDEGYDSDEYYGVYEADSPQHAKEKAASRYKDKEIATTGFYSAQKVTTSQLDKEKKEMEKKIEAKTKIIK